MFYQSKGLFGAQVLIETRYKIEQFEYEYFMRHLVSMELLRLGELGQIKVDLT